jgi:hypothetical protein
VPFLTLEEMIVPRIRRLLNEERCAGCLGFDLEEFLTFCACGECDLVLHKDKHCAVICEGCNKPVFADCAEKWDGMDWCPACLADAKAADGVMSCEESMEFAVPLSRESVEVMLDFLASSQGAADAAA